MTLILNGQVLEALEDSHSLSGNSAKIDEVFVCWSENHDVVVINFTKLNVRSFLYWSIMYAVNFDQSCIIFYFLIIFGFLALMSKVDEGDKTAIEFHIV